MGECTLLIPLQRDKYNVSSSEHPLSSLKKHNLEKECHENAPDIA
jgi:hypothetical protein